MNTFCRILEKYGEEATVKYADKVLTAKTFVQPKIRDGDVVATRLGKVSDGEFYWFAPPELKLDFSENITVTTSEGDFDLITAEKYRALGKESHWEGILKRRY